MFVQDTGICTNMTYIDVRQFTEGFTHANINTHLEKRIQMVRKNMEGFSRKEVKRTELARIVQSKVAHPPNPRLSKWLYLTVLKTSG